LFGGCWPKWNIHCIGPISAEHWMRQTNRCFWHGPWNENGTMSYGSEWGLQGNQKPFNNPQIQQQYIFIHQSLQFVLENFFPFLLSPSSHHHPPSQSQPSSAEQNNSSSRSPAINSRHMPFGSSISSPIGGIHNNLTKESAGGPNSQQFMMLNGSWNLGGQCQPSSPNGPLPWPNVNPKIEVQHQNEGFLEDDEGIAESGLWLIGMEIWIWRMLANYMKFPMMPYLYPISQIKI